MGTIFQMSWIIEFACDGCLPDDHSGVGAILHPGVPQPAAFGDPPRCDYLVALVTLIRLLNIISVKTSDGT
jgi:hypothetical protein